MPFLKEREKVTPFAGVWIEISFCRIVWVICCVTPFAGVWIEILQSERLWGFRQVTPFAGVWIEIRLQAH